ncbi:MAG: TAXI family TRAP transporter solute-binding subunit [Bosea sp. (in: a-proteobacteria)]|jgi:TRAP transporter TAXI family solute receptor
MTDLISRRSVVAGGLGLGAAALIGAPALAQAKQRLTIVTGGTGGVFYPYGGGIAKILTEKLPNMQATSQVTGGSVDNCKLVAAGDADIGFSTLDSAYDAMQGVGAYAKDGKLDVRVLAVLYDSFLHVVGTQGAATTVASLKGKRVSVGSAGSSTESIADRVLEAAGLNPKTDITRDNLGVAESAGALKDGKVAAFFWIGGVPTAAVRDLATSGQPALQFIPTGEELAKLERQWPGLYRPFNLPANAYAGQAAAIPGLGVANVLVVSSKLRDDQVKAALEGIFNNLEEVQKIHPEARRLTLAGAASKSAVPFHRAAEAFYKARGVLS